MKSGSGPSCPMAGLALLLQQCFVSLVVGSGCCPTIMLTVCDEHCESPVCESSEQLLRMLVCVEMYKVKACHDTYLSQTDPGHACEHQLDAVGTVRPLVLHPGACML